MRPEDLLAYVKAAPFRPFRVVMNNGKTYDVPHPEFVKVGRSGWNYFYMDSPDAPFDRVDMASLLLINHIEYLDVPQSASDANGTPPT